MAVKDEVIDGLINILAERGVLKAEDAGSLKREFETNDAQHFEDFLLEEGLVEKDELLQALQQLYGVRAIDVLGEMFDHDLLVMIPKDVLLRNFCLPYYREENILFVITNDPSNDELVEILQKFVSYDIEFFVGIPMHIDMMIKDFYQDELYEIDPEENVAQAEHEDEEYRIHPDEGEYRVHRSDSAEEGGFGGKDEEE
jgi:hypothetical protein